MPQGSPRRRRLAIGLATLAGTLLALELGFRFWLFELAPESKLAKYGRAADLPLHLWLYLPHPYLAFCLNPAYRSTDGLNRHDALGFRGDEITREKPPGTFRIVCLGASTTYDADVPDWREAYPAQLEARLHEHGHASVQVINAGVPGYTSWEIALAFQLRVAELSPDLVIVYEAVNEAKARMVPPGSFRRDGTGFRRAWVERDPWWDRSLVVRYLGVQWGFSPRNSMSERTENEWRDLSGSSAALAANSTAYLDENLENLVVLASHRGIRVLLTSFAHCDELGDFAAEPRFVQGMRENNAAVAALAQRLGVPFYDFAAEMSGDKRYYDDGVHNNAAGARLKSELFDAYLEKSLLAGVP